MLRTINATMTIVVFMIIGSWNGFTQNTEGVVKNTKEVLMDKARLDKRGVNPTGKTRRITLMEDRDQTYMTTKVYTLKNVKASDLTPFVEGAVKRANSASVVGNLTTKGENFLSVSMPNFMVPYIDDMIKKLDRPGLKDDSGSVVAGTGIHHFYYSPNYRSEYEMFNVLSARFNDSDQSVNFGPGMSFFYWKGSKSDGADIGVWLRAMDRPLPQMQLRINIYQVSESDLKELGLDWVAFKNGPAAEIFGIGFDSINLQGLTDLSHMMDLANFSSFTNPGFFVAPNIDLTFLRMLAQKGKARIASSAYLTVANDPNFMIDYTGAMRGQPMNWRGSRFKISFNPVFQAITKSNDQYQEVKVTSRQPELKFFLSAPLICFESPDRTSQAAIVSFAWNLSVKDTMSETTNTGELIQDSFNFSSFTKLRANSEKLIATYVKKHRVNQNNGVPFLNQIPVVKYIFGATTDSWEDYRYYVTIESLPADPMDCTWSAWAGQLVTADEMLKNPVPTEKTKLPNEWQPQEFITPTKQRK